MDFTLKMHKSHKTVLRDNYELKTWNMLAKDRIKCYRNYKLLLKCKGTMTNKKDIHNIFI